MGLHCFTLFCPLQTFNAFSAVCTVYTPKSITMKEKAALYFGYNNWAIALFHSFSLHNFNLDTTHVHTYLGDVWISKQTAGVKHILKHQVRRHSGIWESKCKQNSN